MVVEHTFEVMRPHWTPRDHNFKIFQVQPDCLSENFHILGASILSGWQFFQAIRNFDRKKKLDGQIARPPGGHWWPVGSGFEASILGISRFFFQVFGYHLLLEMNPPHS